MTDLSLTHELLADIDRQIADEEARVRDHLARACPGYSDDHASRKFVNDEWHSFRKRIKPLQEQRDHILQQLVAIKACEPPPVIVVPAGTLME